MITISKITDHRVIKAIITDPKLFALTYGQVMDIKDYKVEDNFTYLLAHNEQEILGLFQTRQFANLVLEAHIYTLPKFWGSSIPVEMSKAGFKWVKENTNNKSVITDVPVSCKHIHKLVEKIGWKCCGNIVNGCMYDNKLQDLVLYQYTL